MCIVNKQKGYAQNKIIIDFERTRSSYKSYYPILLLKIDNYTNIFIFQDSYTTIIPSGVIWRK